MQLEDYHEIDPHEYMGVVLNTDAEAIPVALAREIVRVGSLELWEFQAFFNHDHPVSDPGLEDIALEVAIAELWAKTLRERFPETAFVVQKKPMQAMTWYQVTPNAPTKDDEEFRDFTASYRIQMPGPEVGTPEQRKAMLMEMMAARRSNARTGSTGACEKCGENSGYGEPRTSPIHRGVRLIDCLACGETLVHSTRTVRDHLEADDKNS